MGDRAVYCARLESVCAERHPGFESPPIRCILCFLLALVLVSISRAEEKSALTENFLERARQNFQSGNFAVAHGRLDQFEKVNTATAQSLDLRGCLFMEQDNVAEAAKAFNAP